MKFETQAKFPVANYVFVNFSFYCSFVVITIQRTKVLMLSGNCFSRSVSYLLTAAKLKFNDA